MAVAFLAEVFILPPIIKLMPRVFGAAALRTGLPSLRPDWRCSPSSAAASYRCARRPSRGRPATSRSSVTGFRTVRRRPASRVACPPVRRAEVAARGSRPHHTLGICRRAAGPPSAGRRSEKLRVTDAIARVHEATAEIRLGRFDLYARLRAGSLGAARRAAADRRHQSARRLAVLLRRTQRSAAAGSGRSAAASTSPTTVARRGLRAVLPARPVRSARRAVFSLQHRRGLQPDMSVCLAIGCPLAAVSVQEERAVGALGQRAGWGAFQRHDRPARLEPQRISGFEPFRSSQFRSPARRSAGTSLPVIASTYPRFTMIGGDFETVSGRVGCSRGGSGVRPRQLPDAPIHRSWAAARSTPASASIARPETITSAARSCFTTSGPNRRGGNETGRTDVSFIVSADRTFARDRYQIRAFSVYNPSEAPRSCGESRLRSCATTSRSKRPAGWFAGAGATRSGASATATSSTRGSSITSEGAI